MGEERLKTELLWVWLSLLPRCRQIKEVLAKDIHRLERLWKRDQEEMQIMKATSFKFYEGIADRDLRDSAQVAFSTVQKYGFGVISLEDSRYPPLLKQAPDAPCVLYYKGDIQRCRNCISVVGSRKATAYGLRVAEELSAELAGRGACIVSGMARGIDSKAHQGALRGNGVTCAVIGSGLDVVYPPEHKGLMERIVQQGVVLSEYAPGTMPLPQHFPARNRIISGLSQGLVVVEAGKQSGTLITVDFALEQGRDVFAVPGNIYSEKSAGTNRLIQDGAKVVTDPMDILQEYDWYKPTAVIRGEIPQSQSNQAGLRGILLEELAAGNFQMETVLRSTPYTIQDINGELMMLQLEGMVEKRTTGEYFIKKKKK